jgi:hypothetical protein
MLNPAILEKNLHLFIDFIKDKKFNDENQLTPAKNMAKKKALWQEFKFSNKKD